MGMVMTLVVVVDEDIASDVMAVAREASHEHPARVLGVILGDARGAAAGQRPGRHRRRLVRRDRADPAQGRGRRSTRSPSCSRCCCPTPPSRSTGRRTRPTDTANDPLGALAQRRITDAAGAKRGKGKAIHTQCASYTKGNTDLAWTRITPWRALLAAALDQHHLKVTGASVTAERISPSADLLGAWLGDRLKVAVTRKNSSGPGITEVVLETKEGPISISRVGRQARDVQLARATPTGRSPSSAATCPELLAEELRRLDEDDVYAETARRLVKMGPKA